MINAIGAVLSRLDFRNAMADPTLELHDGTGALIASNDNWQTTIIGGIITQDQVQDIINSGQDRKSVVEGKSVADRPGGNYNKIVSRLCSSTGVGSRTVLYRGYG